MTGADAAIVGRGPSGLAADDVEIVAVRGTAEAAAGETAVIRLLGLIPVDWVCAPRAERDRITLLVRLAGTGGREVVHAAVARAFQDSALRGWRWLN